MAMDPRTRRMDALPRPGPSLADLLSAFDPERHRRPTTLDDAPRGRETPLDRADPGPRGGTLDEFLAEEGILEEVSERVRRDIERDAGPQG